VVVTLRGSFLQSCCPDKVQDDNYHERKESICSLLGRQTPHVYISSIEKSALQFVLLRAKLIGYLAQVAEFGRVFADEPFLELSKIQIVIGDVLFSVGTSAQEEPIFQVKISSTFHGFGAGVVVILPTAKRVVVDSSHILGSKDIKGWRERAVAYEILVDGFSEFIQLAAGTNHFCAGGFFYRVHQRGDTQEVDQDSLR